ncbi:MAG: NFACT family protein [Ruminococcus sp.]|nr:NFACT family protein [Ruminococcus sp.]
MALDGAFLYAVRKEMEGLIGSRVEKVHQPAREEIILSLRSREGSCKVLISASADRARIHLTDVTVENPKAPPMFCMLLRKRLGSGKLLSIRQDGLERVLYLDFSCVNELGDVVQLTLACEIMGRYSNLILIDENGKIIDSIKRVDAEMSSKRLVLPGMLYETPPRDERLNFLETSQDALRDALKGQAGSLLKVLLGTLEGVSPVLVREWAFYAGRGADIRTEEMSEEVCDRLCYAIGRTKEMLTKGECRFTIAVTREGQLKDFSFLPLHQYGTLMITREMPSACALLDHFFAQRDKAARMKQRANDLFRLLVQTTERIGRRISSQTEELEQCKEKEGLRRQADLISANLYRLQKGDSEAILEDFYEPDCPRVTIPLDVRLTPPQNAQRYYAAYKKACTAEKVLAEQIASGREELLYLDSVLDVLTRAETENELEQLRLELAEQGYVRAVRLKGKPPRSLPPMEYISTDGLTILVGRNNKQNDKLTLKDAEKLDYWLHTQNIPGSHVIIRTGGEEPSMQTILEAAQLAAYHSKAQTSSQVPVDYCPVKFVKKPAGTKPGMVIFSNQHTVYVTPCADPSVFAKGGKA